MKVMVENAGACRKKVSVEVPAERVEEEYGRVVKHYISGANIPGFRKGKAPREIVEQRYEEGIVEETRDRLLPVCYQEALKQESLTPLAVIEVSPAVVARSQPMTFDVTVDVRPDIELPDYKGIGVEAETQSVGDKEVDEAIESIRERQAGFEDSERETVQDGDLVQIDYKADAAEFGEPEQALGRFLEAEDFWYPTGDQEFLPGMTAALNSAATGTSVQAEVEFPEAFQIEAVAGKTVTYDVAIKGIREKKLPDLDAAFLEQFSVTDENSLRERISEDLEAMAERNERGRQRDVICKALSEQVEFELPESIVSQESRRHIQNIVYENMMRGVPKDELEKAQEDIHKQAEAVAREQLKLKFILLEIAGAEGMDVDEAEFAAAIRDGATQAGKKPGEYRKELAENDAEGAFREDLLAGKVLDFLLENADVK